MASTQPDPREEQDFPDEPDNTPDGVQTTGSEGSTFEPEEDPGAYA